MADTNVAITAGSGTSIDAQSVPGGDLQQTVTLGDGANAGRVAKLNSGGDLTFTLTSPAANALGIFANLNPYGGQRVSTEPTVVLFDPFDGGTIDATRWSTAGTQVPTQANGTLTVAATVGASVNNNSVLTSWSNFPSPGLGFVVIGGVVTLEAAQTNVVNVHRFWGKGQVTSYAYATPVTDGVGFEVEGTVGALQCVVWVGGTKYVINSTTAALISSSISGAGGSGTALPTGASGSNYGSNITWKGGPHRYAIFVRSDVIYWFIEGQEIPVASAQYLGPQVQGLPLRAASITNGSATSLAHTFQLGAITASDSTSGNTFISDATYPARKVTVKGPSAAIAATDLPLAVGLHPTSPLPTGGNTIGVVNLNATPGFVVGTAAGQLFNARVTATTATTAAVQAAPAGGLALYVTDVSVSNSGATLCTVSFLPAAGTSLLDIVAAANGGGGSVSLKSPLRITTATALNFTTSAASTTVFISVTGFTAA